MQDYLQKVLDYFDYTIAMIEEGVLIMKKRLKVSLPKIGIRPIIDGRRNGVRESLEDQTMNMAKAVEKLIIENLRYPSGEVVECVIADSTIGGVSEATSCAEKFAKEGVGVTISVTPCWCYGSETIDMDPFTPKAIWGFNATERPGAVYLAAALAGHNQKGLPAFGIYGHDVQDKDLASMLRIPVAMHNVSEDRIFRPTTWGAFGTKDKEAADFRACENFGPLYGRK